MNEQTTSSQIESKAFEILENSPEGIRWSDLDALIRDAYPDFHPKTINGTLWKMPEKYRELLSKTDGLFRLSKYKD